MVQNSAHHLLDLIHDVLDISKIEAGELRLDLRPFALPRSVKKAARAVRPMADKQEPGLSTDPLEKPIHPDAFVRQIGRHLPPE